MRRPRRLRRGSALLALASCAAVAACSAAPVPQAVPGRDDGAVVVASFDFAESRLLAELYAQALEAAGVPVRRELALGPRELVLPALRQGLVDVVPEYLGSALSAVSVEAEGVDMTQAHAALRDALGPDRLRVLAPAAAQNQNGLAISRATAERLGVRTTSDLVPHAAGLTLAGPAECPRRTYCLPGLEEVYGLSFDRFVGYARETQRLTALKQDVVDVAVVFTTDGLLASSDYVLLTDDRGLQPVENVVPVVSDGAVARHGRRVVDALNAVSAALDSAGLTFLNWRIEVAGESPAQEARGWLQRHGLLAPAARHEAPA